MTGRTCEGAFLPLFSTEEGVCRRPEGHEGRCSPTPYFTDWVATCKRTVATPSDLENPTEDEIMTTREIDRLARNSRYGKLPLTEMDMVSAYPQVNPNPSRPPEYNFGAVVFRTDPRVVAHCRSKWEIRLDSDGNPESPEAWGRALEAAWALGKKGHAPEDGWVREAELLAERVGRRWDETPIPTLVEALSAKADHWTLGFPTTIIKAGGRSRIATQPQLVFRGCRLVLGSEALVEYLVVEDLKVGHQSCFISCGPVPGCVFSATAFPLWLKMPTANISQYVVIDVRNLGPLDVRVTPMLHGRAAEP